MQAGGSAGAVATVYVPEVLMGEHQKLLLCFTDLRRCAGFFYLKPAAGGTTPPVYTLNPGATITI